MNRSAAFFALLLSALATAGAAAQSRQVPAPPQAKPVVLANATIHTVSGKVIKKGHVAFSDGVITHVGSGSAPRVKNAEVIDARDLHVYPGLISSHCHLGLEETGAVPITHDYSEYGRVTPEVRVAVAVNPDSDLIPVTRANGILTAAVFPRGGLISGRPAVMRLDGWTWEDMAIVTDAGLVLNWPRTRPVRAPWMNQSASQQGDRIGRELREIDELFDAAATYVRARANDPAAPTDLRFEAMRAVLDGSAPLFIRAARAGQIESAVAWAVRRGVKPVIVGGYDADRVSTLLAKHDVPVIIDGLHRLPSARHDAYDRAYTIPLRLHEAGVRFCIASGEEVAHERSLNYNAATAAGYGLPKDEALKAVTLHAAEILGVGAQLGSIEKGKAATLIVTTGDPLEVLTDTLTAFIDGRRIDLGSRQKSLYAKYREKYRQLGILE